MRCVILLLFLLVSVALGADDGQPMEPDGGGQLILLVLAFIGGCFALLVLGVGLFAAAIAAVSAAGLIALGIVSSSALIGIFRRRFSSGFRALHYQAFAAAALPAGAGAFWLGAHLFGSPLPLPQMILIGCLAGATGGLLLAFALDRLVGIVYRWVVSICEWKVEHKALNWS